MNIFVVTDMVSYFHMHDLKRDLPGQCFLIQSQAQLFAVFHWLLDTPLERDPDCFILTGEI